MFKKIISVILLFATLTVFFACDPPDEDVDWYLDRVDVTIKQEFMEKARAEEFTVEDFEWSNVKRIEYFHASYSDFHFLIVYLKTPGKKQVLDAVAYFNTLDFVEDACTVSPQQIA